MKIVKKPLPVSLIITTYNWPEALNLVLKSVMSQSVLPFEVIVADDGSVDETKRLVEQYQNQFPVRLIHSWQDDCGFRAARSRNLAISKSSGDYIVIIDGDIMLPKHFIADHIAAACPNYFVQAGRVSLGNKLTRKLLTGNQSIGLFTSGLRNRKNLIRNSVLRQLFSRTWNSHQSTRSCNMSFWKKDLITVNGFNNEFVGWGREDSELVVRMLNAGIHRQYLKFSAAGLHLHHKENGRESLPENDRLFNKAISDKLISCNDGLKDI